MNDNFDEALELLRGTGGEVAGGVAPNHGPMAAEALGVIDRFPDWVGFFRAKLAETSWRDVFREWIGRLLPATPSAGGHGLIRTAHALRALTHAETSLRVEELGVAL